jgi:hypothetical protein
MAADFRRKMNCGQRCWAVPSAIEKARPWLWNNIGKVRSLGRYHARDAERTRRGIRSEIRQINANTLEDQTTITDPTALTKHGALRSILPYEAWVAGRLSRNRAADRMPGTQS